MTGEQIGFGVWIATPLSAARNDGVGELAHPLNKYLTSSLFQQELHICRL